MRVNRLRRPARLRLLLIGGLLFLSSFAQAADDRRHAELDYALGEALFERAWVSAPASTQAADGLGPLYSARSCSQCHAQAPQTPASSAAPQLLVKLGILASDPNPAVLPDPVYGLQLQEFAVRGQQAEGQLHIEYQTVEQRLDDGSVIVLRKPRYSLQQLAYGPAHPQLLLSPRRAPVLNGLGLLEAIAEQDILARADPDDRDGDGISGRANWVWSDTQQRQMIGRYGWKAASPGIPDQVQTAFVQDLGLSTPLHPQAWGDCTAAQAACREAPHGASAQYDHLEIPQTMIDLVTRYVRYLQLPAQSRQADDITAGKTIFRQSGCAACHVERHVTAHDYALADLAGRALYPYSDLLLHDMGEGLADGRPELEASGREWRTAPLWGNRFKRGAYLHDGRARSVLEAIIWHDGEAQAARAAVARLSAEHRSQLIRFVESL